ncbi:MAG: glucose-1-phosphate adenylyltransferase family protein [Desulfobulbaceae bacterium]|nr:glucose-1-phosphate adenylyltransferase family protein [Desulfobulbaceae bacterium]
MLILAGGVGSRLNILVKPRAKPAVPFAGIYRIIDFALSTVMNSGLNRVGVLTQYKPLSLMNHLGTGGAWDFIGRSRVVKILPPSTGFRDSDWYGGTADAVRQNISFIKSNPSEEVIILSGDHIYQMNLVEMLDFHRRHKADVTVSMMKVPIEEIHQFGTGITDSSGRIVEWDEKPEKPRTNLASMGIYVFNTDYLLSLLAENRKDVDFAIDLIPKAIARDNIFAYPFASYWRDVGTVQVYWQAHMDLLDENSDIPCLESWGARPNIETDGMEADYTAAAFSNAAEVCSSLISAGCTIEGTVIRSVLSPGVVVKPGAVVRDSIIFHDCTIERNAVVDLAILDKEVAIGSGAVVGEGGGRDIANRMYPDHLNSGITLVGREAKLPAGMIVGRNCIISPWTLEDSLPTHHLEDGETL